MPKITALPVSAGLALADLLAVVDDPGGVPATQQATLTQLKALLDTIYAPITGGAYVLKAGDTMTGRLIITQATANTSILTSTGYSLTGANAQNMLDFAGTWNTSGNPSALKIAITNTASGATAKFLELLAGAGGVTSILNIDLTGRMTWIGNSYMYPRAAGFFTFGKLSDGDLVEFNDEGVLISGAGDNGLSFGSTVPAGVDISLRRDAASTLAQRVGTTAQIFRLYRTFTNSTNYERLALQTAAGQMIIAAETAGTGTDNLDVVLTAAGTGLVNASTGIFRLGTAFTVAALPAAGTQGRIAYVTDALAPAFLAIVVGGGGIITTVFDNGTNWVAV